MAFAVDHHEGAITCASVYARVFGFFPVRSQPLRIRPAGDDDLTRHADCFRDAAYLPFGAAEGAAAALHAQPRGLASSVPACRDGGTTLPVFVAPVAECFLRYRRLLDHEDSREGSETYGD
jgi:hypothetical protein